MSKPYWGKTSWQRRKSATLYVVHSNNTHSFTVLFKQQSSQRLGEDISSLVCGGDMVNADFSSFFSITNKVMPYVNVFHSIMIL